MEKYSRYRDKGSGIAPFQPIQPEQAGIYLPLYLLLFTIRLPILILTLAVYFLVLSWFPIGSLVKKAALWIILGVPGIWWVDIQVDGVRRGTLARHVGIHNERLPQPGSIIASSLTSPIDPLYLSAIFDPVFTISYPKSRLVRPASLLSAVLHSFSIPTLKPADSVRLCTLAEVVSANPDRPVVVFPECTTTNGRAILPLSPSMLAAPKDARIFPTSLRYSPADITTPIPRSYLSFLWSLCSRPTHTIRVRVAKPVTLSLESMSSVLGPQDHRPNSYATNFLDSLAASEPAQVPQGRSSSDIESDHELSKSQQAILDTISESLARLGRVRRVLLDVRDKIDFYQTWRRR